MEIMEYKKTYQEYKQELDAVLTRTAEDFVQIGYLLKVARDTNILAESGYANVVDFAKAEYSIDKTQVSRFISINDRFSEDGYSDHLLPTYQGFGYAKLTLMLQIPEEITAELTPNFSKAEIQQIKDEVDAESKISDIEVEIERAEAAAVTDKPMLPPEGSPLYRNLWQLGKEQEELFRKLWEVCFAETERKSRNNAEIMDVLIPQGDAVYTVRIPGERRTQIIINQDGATIINMKTLERDKYGVDPICVVARTLVTGGSSPEECYRELYGEDMTTAEPEVAPVQPDTTEPKKEKKPEKHKESRVTKANTEKSKPKEPERQPEQMTIPGAAPDPAPVEPEKRENDTVCRESETVCEDFDTTHPDTDTTVPEEQIPRQTDLETDYPQYCPDANDQRAAYRHSIRGSVENLVRYVEMDLIAAARQQLSDISGYLDRLEELSKGGDADAEAVEAGEGAGV